MIKMKKFKVEDNEKIIYHIYILYFNILPSLSQVISLAVSVYSVYKTADP